MGCHRLTTATALVFAGTPIAVDKFKTADTNRNPNTDIQLKANEDRDNAMKDCPGTTILMNLSQFYSACLYDLAADFDQVVDHKYAPLVWRSFQAKLGRFGPSGKQKKKPLEKDVSAAWSAVDSRHHLCPNHFLNLSEEKPDTNDDSKYKVDASFISNKHRKTIVSGKPNWPYIGILIEFKRGGTANDPFDDKPDHDPDATAKTRVAVRGQLMSYGGRLFSYQHRVAVYLLFINGDTFRVMRWDRSGVIVTEAINYVRTISGTKALLKVTHAFSKMSLEQQGFDLNVTMLVPRSCGYQRMDLLALPCNDDLDYHECMFDDSSAMHMVFTDADFAASFGTLCKDGHPLLHVDPSHDCKNHAASHRASPPVIPVLSFVRELFKRTLVSGYPRYMIKIGDRHYLVGKHIFIAFGLVGRGTRGYVALEWETQRFVFLKDSWRPYYEGLEQEGAVLSSLNDKEILNVPTVVQYEDVHYTTGDRLEQETEASHYSPVTGGKSVDDSNSSPMFSPLPGEEAELMEWLQSNTEADDPSETYRKLLATSRESVETESNPFSEPVEAVTMPEPLAGPSKNVLNPPSSDRSGGVKRSAEEVEREDKWTQGHGLRHMVHSRTVVKEVCLSMTEFTSSFQLTRIILSAFLAYESCGYMHRDVSAGNILIYPVVKCSNGKWSIYWRGILADWELAKHKDKHTAMQPQRTGTWYFMSAYLLAHPASPTTIPDELEAFLHVYVYNAVRRLNSNLNKITGFMNTYFAGYDLDDTCSAPTCPSSKRLSVVKSATLQSAERAVVFSNPEGTVTKEHHVNQLIAELLRMFHARYVVLEYREQERISKLARDGPHTPRREPQATKLNIITENAMERNAPPKNWSSKEAFRLQQEPVILSPPSQEDDELARSIEEHHGVLGLFFTFLTEMEWRKDDVVPDRQDDIVISRKALQATQVTGRVPGTTQTSKSCVVVNAAEETHEHVSENDVPTPVADAPAVRPTKRRRKDPVVQTAAPGSEGEPPVAGPSTGRITWSRSAANVGAVPNTTATTTRVTRSMSGVLPTRGGQRASSSRGSGRSNTVSRTASGSGGTRGRTRASSRAGPGHEDSDEQGSGKGKGVAGRSRRR
ncbi:hypothetical protein L227DRAFT_616887 [Lentinus tigrinus ALCF2SS1-6]|uniref:Fungal-type protein kinase domain-containing protein n=1 Tax=Lentinus tigrinus ALCF2SS1-6 TaxID=1328759 RepID=A0A5C2RPQ6_9APHY|nr:hypothetical protein L227DRAFT_616887 [Lentinus tigrinus ALCF2SS1-6]